MTRRAIAVRTEPAPGVTAALGAARDATGAAQRRFLANVSSNAAYIAAQTIATLWMTPFIIGEMGMAAFGVISLVHVVTSYFSIVTTALDSAVSRFLAIDLSKHDHGAANRTFNTALIGTLAVMAALSPIVMLVALAFPSIFAVPAGWETDSTWLFASSAAAFFITVVGGIFAVSPFVYSRFVWINGVNLFGLALRVALVAILFSVLPAQLWYAGVALLAGAAVCLAGHVGLWRRLTPELHMRRSAFDIARMRMMLSMSGWLMVNMIGAMLLGRVDLIVVNAYYGTAITGGYAAVAQLALLLEYLVNAAAVVIRPVVLAKYALGDFDGLQVVAAQSVRLLGLALALPVGLLCGFSRPLLTFWLGSSFSYLASLLVVLAVHQALNLSVRPLLHVQNAYDRVKWPGTVTLISGVAGLVLAIAFAQWGRWGYLGVASAIAIVWTAKNGLYMPVYTAFIMGLRWWSYFPCLVPGIVGTISVGATAYALVQVSMPDSILTLAASALAVSSAYAVFAWLILMNSSDQQLIRGVVARESVAGVPR